MIQRRPWIPVFLAGCTWAQVALGQTGLEPAAPAGGTPSSPGAPGAPSSPQSPGSPSSPQTPGSPNTPGSPQTPGTPSTPGTPGSTPTPRPGEEPSTPPRKPKPGTTPGSAPADDPFGFGQPGVLPGLPGLAPGQPGTPSGTGPGASTSFGPELPRNVSPQSTEETKPATKPTALPETFTAPGLYGSGQQTFTSGQGRFTRPRYRYSVSASMGFDDNIFQTSNNSRGVPDQVVKTVIPGEPEIAVFQPVTTFDTIFLGGKFVPTNFRTTQRKIVLRPAVPPQTVETVIPGFEPQQRQTSLVTSVDGRFDMQWVKSRSAFTLDFRAGAEYYWNRDSDPADYNGSFAMTYVRRLTARAQLSGNAAFSHQTSPDYSQINLVTSGNTKPGESYTTGAVKLDLSYRWGSRFSTVTSVSGNGIVYEGSRSDSSFWEALLGNEFRYIWSRRYTYVVEARYSQLNYLKIDDQNSTDIFLLLGLDYRLSQRLSATLRLGETNRTYETSGIKKGSPYGELSVNYSYDRKNQFGLSGRYGFEQGSIPSQQNQTTRFGLNYTRLFTPRLSATLNLNYVNNALSNEIAGGITQENSNTTYDFGLSAQYVVNRSFSLSARYSYTSVITDSGFSDFDRSRFFLTGQYEF